jgi:hypothetical protein
MAIAAELAQVSALLQALAVESGQGNVRRGRVREAPGEIGDGWVVVCVLGAVEGLGIKSWALKPGGGGTFIRLRGWMYGVIRETDSLGPVMHVSAGAPSLSALRLALQIMKLQPIPAHSQSVFHLFAWGSGVKMNFYSHGSSWGNHALDKYVWLAVGPIV